jgi:hypothetical protein
LHFFLFNPGVGKINPTADDNKTIHTGLFSVPNVSFIAPVITITSTVMICAANIIAERGQILSRGMFVVQEIKIN